MIDTFSLVSLTGLVVVAPCPVVWFTLAHAAAGRFSILCSLLSVLCPSQSQEQQLAEWHRRGNKRPSYGARLLLRFCLSGEHISMHCLAFFSFFFFCCQGTAVLSRAAVQACSYFVILLGNVVSMCPELEIALSVLTRTGCKNSMAGAELALSWVVSVTPTLASIRLPLFFLSSFVSHAASRPNPRTEMSQREEGQESGEMKIFTHRLSSDYHVFSACQPLTLSLVHCCACWPSPLHLLLISLHTASSDQDRPLCGNVTQTACPSTTG